MQTNKISLAEKYIKALIVIGVLFLSVSFVYARTLKEHNDQGLAYLKQHNFTAAITEFTKAVEIDPKDAASYYLRGTIYYNQGNFIQAISDFSQAIAINPKVAKGYRSRALSYLRANNANEAIADLTKVVAINPNDARAYFNRAVGYYQLKQYDKAWADVHKAQGLGVRVNPDFIEALTKAK